MYVITLDFVDINRSIIDTIVVDYGLDIRMVGISPNNHLTLKLGGSKKDLEKYVTECYEESRGFFNQYVREARNYD